MEKSVLNHFGEQLRARKRRIVDWINGDGASKHTQLGGCSEEEICLVGALDQALREVESGEFGACAECEGDVELDRLHLDFTTRVCLEHYSEDRLRALERDLELAAKMQAQLFPSFVPALESIEIAAYARPAHVVGGDYYDFFPYRDSDQGIIIADVMGKGLSASMLMSNLQATLRILGPECKAPHELASRLNEMFRYNVNVRQFISVFLVCLDKERGGICYCNAGHNPAVLWDARKRKTRRLIPTGPALGLVHEPDYGSATIDFSPGDVLVLYTDGLVEARDADGAEFGADRLDDVVAAAHTLDAQRIVGKIRSKVDEFATGPPKDDALVLVMKHV